MPRDVTREPIYKTMLIIVVVQFYPELKYILFPLLDMMIYYNEFETKGNKI